MSPAPAAQVKPISFATTIVTFAAGNAAKSMAAEVVVKGADGKDLVLVLDKASVLKNKAGKTIKISTLKKGEAVNVVYLPGDKTKLLVSLTLAK
jgi:hypothetical protein